MHSIAFNHNAPQSTDFQSKPTVVHSCTVHELGQNSFQLTLKIPTQLLRARNGGVTPHFWSLMSDEEHQENYMKTKRKKWFWIFFFFSKSTFKSFGNTNRNIKMIQVNFAEGKGYIPEREDARNQQTCPAKEVGGGED